MISLNWEAIEDAGDEYVSIAIYMQESGICTAGDIVNALNIFDKSYDKTALREAMRLDEWDMCLRSEWEGGSS